MGASYAVAAAMLFVALALGVLVLRIPRSVARHLPGKPRRIRRK